MLSRSIESNGSRVGLLLQQVAGKKLRKRLGAAREKDNDSQRSAGEGSVERRVRRRRWREKMDQCWKRGGRRMD